MQALLFVGSGHVAIAWAVRRLLQSSRAGSPPSVNAIETSLDPALQLGWAALVGVSTFVALSGLWSCFAVSVWYHYAHVTSVACGNDQSVATRNFMPSISACIGDFSLQRSIWSATVALYVQQRLFSGVVVFRTFARQSRLLGAMRLATHTLEQLCLIGLTAVTSTADLLCVCVLWLVARLTRDTHSVHQVFFALFWIGSMLNMLQTCVLTYKELAAAPGHAASSSAVDRLRLSLQWRSVATVVHATSSVGALYWYWRHSVDCGDYQYSYFGLCEWTVVLSNIAFHTCEVFDGRDTDLILFTRPPSNKREF
jgi:hypothetical protein